MEIISITSKDILDNFIGSQPTSQFLQSWDWGEFQKKVGKKVIRIGAGDGNGLAAAATLIKTPLFLGFSYFYCPRGPILKLKVESEKLKVYNCFFDGVAKIAQKENALFLRFEPNELANNFTFLTFKFKLYNTIDIQPAKTSVIDLSKSEEEIMAAMHQKTRYNIRLAEKKGVEVVLGSQENFNDFWGLMIQTKERDGFKPHNREYYREMIKLPTDSIKIFFARRQGRNIAAVIVFFFGNTAVYAHGASSYQDRSVMAPFLLQWQAIKTAKQQGRKFYDFYGVDEKKWPGVTRFKEGFGGQAVNFSGTFDLVFNKRLYGAYKFFRKIRREL